MILLLFVVFFFVYSFSCIFNLIGTSFQFLGSWLNWILIMIIYNFFLFQNTNILVSLFISFLRPHYKCVSCCDAMWNSFHVSCRLSQFLKNIYFLCLFQVYFFVCDFFFLNMLFHMGVCIDHRQIQTFQMSEKQQV